VANGCSKLGGGGRRGASLGLPSADTELRGNNSVAPTALLALNVYDASHSGLNAALCLDDLRVGSERFACR